MATVALVIVYQINSKFYYHRFINTIFYLLLGSFGGCFVRSSPEPS